MYTVITKDECPFCGSAKTLLDKVGQGYTEYNVQTQSSKWILTLLKKANVKTVKDAIAKIKKYIDIVKKELK